MPVADPNAPESFGPPFHASAVAKPTQPSAYWGDEKIWNQRANNHNGMFDKNGRVWFAAAVRGFDNPAFCKKGSDHPSAKVFPLEQSGRQVAMLDPTMKYSFIDTCFGTHHPQFGYDADNTLWLSGTGLPIRRKETPRDCSGVAQDTPQRLRGRSVVGFIPLFLKSGVSRKWVFMNRN